MQKENVSCKFPEFNELYDQTKNRYRPYPYYCAASALALVSAVDGGSYERPGSTVLSFAGDLSIAIKQGGFKCKED